MPLCMRDERNTSIDTTWSGNDMLKRNFVFFLRIDTRRLPSYLNVVIVQLTLMQCTKKPALHIDFCGFRNCQSSSIKIWQCLDMVAFFSHNRFNGSSSLFFQYVCIVWREPGNNRWKKRAPNVCMYVAEKWHEHVKINPKPKMSVNQAYHAIIPHEGNTSLDYLARFKSVRFIQSPIWKFALHFKWCFTFQNEQCSSFAFSLWTKNE